MYDGSVDYFEFQRCRESFARGQKDARPEIQGGCYYRLRGRTHRHWTLLSFADPEEAWEQLREFRRNGDKVQSVNYTLPKPKNVPTKRGPVEYVVEDFAALVEAPGERGQSLRRAARKATAVSTPPKETALTVFNKWVLWAKERHFMVFTGQYLAWLEMFYVAPGPTQMVGIDVGGKVEGIFGWETHTSGLRQVTLAKHTPELPGRSMWTVGLLAMGIGGPILCGSTADKLKHDMGMAPLESWVFDLTKLEAPVA